MLSPLSTNHNSAIANMSSNYIKWDAEGVEYPQENEEQRIVRGELVWLVVLF